MSNELTVAPQTGVAETQAPEQNILAVIARAAADPNVDTGKMRELLDMQERFMRTRAEMEFNAAMARIQPKMPRVNKHGQIVVHNEIRSKFARYEDLDAAIRPLLEEEGFAQDFDSEDLGAKMKVVLCVSHRMGHKERRQITLPYDASGAKSGTQGTGSTYTFGKRYLVQNFWNIITTDDPLDDDGQGGCISLDQQIVINDLLKEVKADTTGFLKFMGASSVDAIPVAQYQKAINALERKRR